MSRLHRTATSAIAVTLIALTSSVFGVSSAVARDHTPSLAPADQSLSVEGSPPAHTESFDAITVVIQLPEVASVLRGVICWVSMSASRLVHDWMPMLHEVEVAWDHQSSAASGQVEAMSRVPAATSPSRRRSLSRPGPCRPAMAAEKASARSSRRKRAPVRNEYEKMT